MSTATAVRERGILFSGPMVRALLAGTKTQTRRVVKLPHYATLENAVASSWDVEAAQLRATLAPETAIPLILGTCAPGAYLLCNRVDDVGVHRARCPYGQPGDRLYVRETWCRTGAGVTQYRADEKADQPYWSLLSWKPSIHMPRWASRISLELTGVRVEQLQDISEADILAEGVDCRIASERTGIPWSDLPTLHDAWRAVWDQLNADRGYGWDANPWVWCLSFQRVD